MMSGPVPVAVRSRHLVDSDGRPFFWLGDTAWELVHRLSRDQILHYADVRQRQGFNVCQFVALAELDGLRTPNVNGDLPLIDEDPATPNEAYFEHVDFAVQTLNERGMVACLLPTWGDKFNLMGGEGPEVFPPDNAAVFGDWIGNRYRDAAMVWMLGGDRPCADDEDRAIIAEMAAGLRSATDGRHLISYHPRGPSTSIAALDQDPDWMDFHCIQSSHSRHADTYGLQASVRSQTSKPVLEAEPAYEEMPYVDRNWDDFKAFWPTDLLKANLYDAVLAGSPGVTYGCHPVWQMHDTHRKPVLHVRRTWHESLELPVAESVADLRRQFEAIDWWTLSPESRGQARLPDGRAVRYTDGRLIVE
jgi:hypothetical protein